MLRYRLVIYLYLSYLPRPWIVKPISSEQPQKSERYGSHYLAPVLGTGLLFTQ